MLRITQQNSTDAAKSYYTSADYYSEGQELVGRWGGEGARMLGLDGRVSRREFSALCDNRHPRTGEQLTPRNKDDRTVGYDFTWSVPKSFSLLYAVTEDPALLDAFRELVGETMREIETEMKARVRKKGRNEERVTGNMTWAEFVHFTSRPVDGVPDPQLHAHCFVFNVTWDGQEDGWKAGQFRDLKRDAPYWQAAFRARLANRLQAMGYAVERKRDDFELAGVPASAIRRFARRTDKIEQEARRRGIEDPEQKAKLGGLTRERKDKSLSWKELRSEWDSRLTPDERQAIAAVIEGRGSAAVPVARNAESVDFAVRHEFAKEAVVQEKTLLATALKHGLGAVTVEGVKDAAARRHQVEQRHGRRVVTTPEMLALEDRIVAFVRDGRGAFQSLGDPDEPLARSWLNAGQQAAVRHILGSRDRVTLIRGGAGTGKTSLMQEAVERIAGHGHQVVTMAPSTGASRDVLREEAGFKDADTVARFLVDRTMQQRAAGGVIWVDEASMLSNRDMAALFDVAKAVDARVILMGDRRQHGSVAAGAPLKLLEDQAGVRLAEVTEIMRQEDGDHKTAVRLLSEGRTDEGFDMLDRLGWVREVPDAERYLRLAEAYLAAAGERKRDGSLKSALVVSPTHAEGDRITDAIRSALAEQGRLRGERELTVYVPLHLTEAERGEADSYMPGDMLQFHQNAKGYKSGERLRVGEGPLPLDQAARFQAYRPASLRLAEGDRLRITANGNTADGRHRLNNGALYTVKGFSRDGNIVLENGWQIGRDFGHIAHGYAVTSHGSQAKTVDEVFIGQSSLSLPASNRAQLYVSVSRGKKRALIFTDDKRALRQAVRRDGERLTATEVFRPQTRKDERFERHLSLQRRYAAYTWPATRNEHDRNHARELMYERQ